jgi:hypothetical protein
MGESERENSCLDLSAIAVGSLLDAERMFGKNSEDFLEEVQKKKTKFSKEV